MELIGRLGIRKLGGNESVKTEFVLYYGIVQVVMVTTMRTNTMEGMDTVMEVVTDMAVETGTDR